MKSNEQLQKDVQDELAWEHMLNAAEIGVIAKDGVITLTGKTDSYFKKATAEKAAKRVAGVKAVATDIDVKFTDSVTDDSNIAAAALNALEWHSFVPHEKMKLDVEDGWVTLEGQVDWQYQKDSAINCIENLLGVKGITNLITIKPHIATKVVKENISRALHRSATVDSSNITVEATGNKVILKGKVHSWYEKNEAEKAAWNAPGVVTVEDELTVAPY